MQEAMARAGAEAATDDSGQRSSLLRVEDLKVEFATDRGWVTVVDGVGLDVNLGETVGIVGESGSGKTVTGLSVMGLVSRPGRIAGGRIDFDGVDLTREPESRLRKVRGDDIAMVFQEPMTSLNPAFTIGDQIAETVRHHRRTSRKAARDRAVEVLELVGIAQARRRLGSYPHEFSGGMRQRVMIAMALSCEPRLLIADEPTTALDVTIQAQIIELLDALQAELGMAVLFVTHDLGVVAEVCDRVVVMYAGQVVETARVDQLYRKPRHPYTEGLLASMPQVGADSRDLESIPGRTPDPWAMPRGCRFHPRCPYAASVCVEQPPPLAPLGDERRTRCARHEELDLRGTP